MPMPSALPRKLKGEMASAGRVERLRTIKAQDNQLHGSAKRILSSTAVERADSGHSLRFAPRSATLMERCQQLSDGNCWFRLLLRTTLKKEYIMSPYLLSHILQCTPWC